MGSFLLVTVLVAVLTLAAASDYATGRGGYKKPYYSQPQTYPVPVPYPVQQPTSSGCGGCGCGCNGRRKRDADQSELPVNNNESATEMQSSLPPNGFVQMIYPDGKSVLVPIAVSPSNRFPGKGASAEKEAVENETDDF